jgi:hypothetical protein
MEQEKDSPMKQCASASMHALKLCGCMVTFPTRSNRLEANEATSLYIREFTFVLSGLQLGCEVWAICRQFATISTRCLEFHTDLVRSSWNT